jgi:RNase_H superfamily
MHGPATLERRLATFRAATRAHALDTPWQRAATPDLAERMAEALDGEVVRTANGSVVRREPRTRDLPIDRERLGRLPGQPPPHVPLVCLDIETTGLATAAGTVAFLVGLGWWEGDRFRQVQLLLPDHAEESALLDLIAERIAPDAWLVTYNGRGFDWPLLVTRYRMARRAPPEHGGHLDLLPFVRRLFRHRMADARLRTAEAELLGLRRIGDVEGWQIPGRYLDFLRGGPADPLVEVVRHNDQDVRSLAHLVGHLERGYADSDARRAAPPGDLAGLARAFARERRYAEALDCLDAAVTAPPPAAAVTSAPEPIPFPRPPRTGASVAHWWEPAYEPDFGGRPRPAQRLPEFEQPASFAAPWSEERLYLDRAHVLRRLGRIEDACEAWSALSASPGRLGVVAAIELAKLREHRLRDPVGALEAATRGMAAAERRRRLGRPEPALEANLDRRLVRLRRRLAATPDVKAKNGSGQRSSRQRQTRSRGSDPLE